MQEQVRLISDNTSDIMYLETLALSCFCGTGAPVMTTSDIDLSFIVIEQTASQASHVMSTCV